MTMGYEPTGLSDHVAAINESIREHAERISFGSVLAGRAITTVALDAHGVLVEYRPEGTSVELAHPSGTALRRRAASLLEQSPTCCCHVIRREVVRDQPLDLAFD